jgi:hypothetical protein
MLCFAESVRCQAPSTQPVSRETPAATSVHHVEVTILGRVADVKGIEWLTDARHELALSAGMKEHCDVTIRLPGGRILRMRTRPILVVERLTRTDIITGIIAPPEGEEASMADKVREVEGLLATWHAVPNEHMRALLDEFKKTRDSGAGIEAGNLATDENVGHADLDAGTEVTFRFSRGPTGRWTIVALIDAKQAEWERVWREANVDIVPTTGPSTKPTSRSSQK